MADNMDQIKEMFTDTNPYFLGLTIVVSCLHSIFEFLAIKNGNIEILNCRYLILEKCKISLRIIITNIVC